MAPEQCMPPAVPPIPLGSEDWQVQMTARVEMTASLDSRIRFSIWKVEFHLVIHSCLGLSSGTPICRWVDLSFSVAVVLLWRNSTITFTLSTVGLITFRASLTNRLTVFARPGWWVHFRIFIFHVTLFCHFEQLLCYVLRCMSDWTEKKTERKKRQSSSGSQAGASSSRSLQTAGSKSRFIHNRHITSSLGLLGVQLAALHSC